MMYYLQNHGLFLNILLYFHLSKDLISKPLPVLGHTPAVVQ